MKNIQVVTKNTKCICIVRHRRWLLWSCTANARAAGGLGNGVLAERAPTYACMHGPGWSSRDCLFAGASSRGHAGDRRARGRSVRHTSGKPPRGGRQHLGQRAATLVSFFLSPIIPGAEQHEQHHTIVSNHSDAAKMQVVITMHIYMACVKQMRVFARACMRACTRKSLHAQRHCAPRWVRVRRARTQELRVSTRARACTPFAHACAHTHAAPPRNAFQNLAPTLLT